MARHVTQEVWAGAPCPKMPRTGHTDGNTSDQLKSAQKRARNNYPVCLAGSENPNMAPDSAPAVPALSQLR